MSKKSIIIGGYVLVLAAGIVFCRGRTIPLYPPHPEAHRASLLLPASAHTVHSRPLDRKKAHLSRHHVA